MIHIPLQYPTHPRPVNYKPNPILFSSFKFWGFYSGVIGRKSTVVSEEYIASIFRVKYEAKQGNIDRNM
jgi:hypothetical protein